MMSSGERKCPLCKQIFLENSDNQQFSGIGFHVVPRGVEAAIERVREMVPQASEETIRQHLAQTRSINMTIAHLLAQPS